MSAHVWIDPSANSPRHLQASPPWPRTAGSGSARADRAGAAAVGRFPPRATSRTRSAGGSARGSSSSSPACSGSAAPTPRPWAPRRRRSGDSLPSHTPTSACSWPRLSRRRARHAALRRPRRPRPPDLGARRSDRAGAPRCSGARPSATSASCCSRASFSARSPPPPARWSPRWLAITSCRSERGPSTASSSGELLGAGFGFAVRVHRDAFLASRVRILSLPAFHCLPRPAASGAESAAARAFWRAPSAPPVAPRAQDDEQAHETHAQRLARRRARAGP